MDLLTAIDVLHPSRLDWAFAGFSSSEIRTNPEGNAIVHSIWQHWVDSRTQNAETVTDEGDMYPQTDGRTLELGSMINPDTGRMTQYEERWKDVEPTSTDMGEGDKEDRKVCVVFQLHDDDHKARGVVVRVGQCCQGVLRVGDDFSLERWQWKKGGGWKREVRIGDLWLPCGPILEGERLRLGGEMKYGEYLWEVIEMSEF